MVTQIRPYQQLAISQMQEPARMGYAVALPVGSGKTRIVAKFFAEMRQANRIDHMVVLCTKNTRQQWIEELDMVESGLSFLATVTNIEQIRNIRGHGYKGIENVLKGQRCVLVVDESQRIANDTQQTKAAIALGRFSFYRIIMSGTMIDRPENIFYQFAFLSGNNRNLLSCESYYQFRAFYCKMKDRVFNGRKVQQITGYQNLDSLKIKIAQNGIIRTREEVMPDLPPVIYVTRHIELGERATKAYKEMNDSMEAALTDFFGDEIGEPAKATIVLTQLLRLQQIASGFLPVSGDEHSKGYVDFEHDKVDEVMDILAECGENAKVIIFCRFLHEIQILEARMAKEGIYAVSIRGRSLNVEASKRAFQEGDAQVVIVGIQAGGVGLNLQSAAAVIFMSLPFSSIDFAQCVGRGDRLGRTGSLIVFQLALKVEQIKETIDEKIMRALEKKTSLREYIFGREHGDRTNC